MKKCHHGYSRKSCKECVGEKKFMREDPLFIFRYSIREVDLVQADTDPNGNVLKCEDVFKNGHPTKEEINTFTVEGTKASQEILQHIVEFLDRMTRVAPREKKNE